MKKNISVSSSWVELTKLRLWQSFQIQTKIQMQIIVFVIAHVFVHSFIVA